MNLAERVLRRIDGFQQRHLPTAFAFGVVKKYGDDNSGALAVQLTYSMFVTVFPLLLLVITILGIVLAGDPSARMRVADSAFGQFPIVGPELAHNIHALKRSSPFGLTVGIIGVIYGSTGLAQTGQYAMAQIWDIPAANRPNYLARLGRSMIFLVILGVGLIATTTLSSFGTFGRHNVALGYVAEVLAGVVNIGLYLLAFRVLTPKQVETRCLVPGSVVGGIAWTVLQAIGGYVVGHQLKGATATYGMFGLVLGLLAWISFGAAITLYAAEINTVLHRHLWPRSLVQPPLTKADQESIASQVLKNQRRPEQEVITNVRGTPTTEDEYRQQGYQFDRDGIGLSRSVPEGLAAPVPANVDGDPSASNDQPERRG